MSSSPESARLPGAIIFGCAGTSLGEHERLFFESANPFGFILFRRNIDTPDQLKSLVSALRASVGRTDAPVLIDQEGGRVARLTLPHWPTLPPARAIGQLAEQDPAGGLAAAKASGRIIGAMLADLDIDVACAPVLDLLLPETHSVIGNRAFSADPSLVATLGAAVCEGLVNAGVTPIVKHIPGHGRATTDSHLALPRIAASRGELDADFTAFRGAPETAWGMVAHCVYEAFDAALPASISPSVIAEVIRGSIGFDGVLIADDIGMKALQGSLADNAAATLAAGCDLTLHCSGDLAEMQHIAPAVSVLSDIAMQRLKRSTAKVQSGKSAFDATAERAILSALVSA